MIARRWPHLVGAVLFGLLLYMCLPRQVIAYDDDFGYLRSVVATLQHGRPWTDDWLEPWSASLSLASAALYALTGSFYLATYGLLPVFAGVSFAFCSRLLAERSSQILGLLLAAAGLTFPTVFWKTIQFTGVALYLPCLLGAIWAWQRQRWILFAACWGVALGTRQSAIGWIALPLGSLLLARRSAAGTASSRRAPAVVAGFGLTLFLALAALMNETYVQRTDTNHALARIGWDRAFLSAATAADVFFVMAGIGSLLAAFRPENRSLRPGAVRLCLALAAAASCLADVRGYFYWDHAGLAGTLGLIWAKVLVAAGILGWSFRGAAWQWPLVAAAAANTVLLAIRGVPWDYYFIDVAAFGLFGRSFPVASAASAATPASRRDFLRLGPLALALGVAAFFSVIHFKAVLDRAAGLCSVAEKALRRGQIQADELGFCPLGYVGWQLLPYYLTHDAAAHGIADFGLYLKPETIQVGQHYSRSLRRFAEFNRIAPSDRHNLVAMEKFPFLWLYESEYYLLRAKPADSVAGPLQLGPDFRREVFPLNDAEWTALIEHAALPAK